MTVDRQLGTFLKELASYDERHLTIDEVSHDLQQPTTVDRHLGTLLEQDVSYIERHLTTDETFHANEFIQGGYERQVATSHDQSTAYFNERLADPRPTTTSFAILHDNAQPTTETLSEACSFDYTKLLCQLIEALVFVGDSNISADAFGLTIDSILAEHFGSQLAIDHTGDDNVFQSFDVSASSQRFDDSLSETKRAWLSLLS